MRTGLYSISIQKNVLKRERKICYDTSRDQRERTKRALGEERGGKQTASYEDHQDQDETLLKKKGCESHKKEEKGGEREEKVWRERNQPVVWRRRR